MSAFCDGNFGRAHGPGYHLAGTQHKQAAQFGNHRAYFAFQVGEELKKSIILSEFSAKR